MIVERFKPEHARQIELQSAQSDAALVDMPYLEILHSGGPAATMKDEQGRVLCCAGLLELPHVSHLWCFLSRHSGPHMLAIYRGAQRLISIARSPVIATSVCGFEPGCRLLLMLGFQWCQKLPGMGFSGEDHDFYVRQ